MLLPFQTFKLATFVFHLFPEWAIRWHTFYSNTVLRPSVTSTHQTIFKIKWNVSIPLLHILPISIHTCGSVELHFVVIISPPENPVEPAQAGAALKLAAFPLYLLPVTLRRGAPCSGAPFRRTVVTEAFLAGVFHLRVKQ